MKKPHDALLSKQLATPLLLGIVLFISAASARSQITVISDFDDGIPDWDLMIKTDITQAVEDDGSLTIRAQLPPTNGRLGNSITGVAWTGRDFALYDGETLELAVDLIGTSRGDVFAGLDYNSTGTSENGLYSLLKNENELLLTKVLNPGTANVQAAQLIYTNAFIKHSNVSLRMGLTRIGSSVKIVVSVVDNEGDGAVLFQTSFLDTSNVDPTLQGLPPVFASGTDPGPPLLNGRASFLQMNQITDGLQPITEATFDNFRYERRSAVKLKIEHGPRLSWPAFNRQFIVEGASSFEGPWVTIDEPITPIGIENVMMIPTTNLGDRQFFRLREIP